MILEILFRKNSIMKRASVNKQVLCTLFIILCNIFIAFPQSILPRIYLYPEYYVPAISTTVRVDSPLQGYGLGTTLNLENELGFDKTKAMLRFQAIVGRGSQIALSFMNIDRNGSAILTRDIAFDDTVYHVGANANAYFNSQIFGVSWRLSIINNPIITAGLSIGGKWIQAETGINVQSGELIYSRDVKAGVPVPLAGLHASVNITPQLMGRASAEYLHLSIRGYSATAEDYRIAAEYYFLKNLGAGIGYSFMKYQVNKFPFNNDFSGEIDYSLKGFSFLLAARF
jgi:hypothetical protein